MAKNSIGKSRLSQRTLYLVDIDREADAEESGLKDTTWTMNFRTVILPVIFTTSSAVWCFAQRDERTLWTWGSSQICFKTMGSTL